MLNIISSIISFPHSFLLLVVKFSFHTQSPPKRQNQNLIFLTLSFCIIF